MDSQSNDELQRKEEEKTLSNSGELNLPMDIIAELMDDDIPAEKREKFYQLLFINQHHSGPLPHPYQLEKYNSIIENGAERIMQNSEKESQHRRNMEAKLITTRSNQIYLGFAFALVIALAVIAASVYLAIKGYELPAAVFAGAFALCAVFITRKNTNNKPSEKS